MRRGMTGTSRTTRLAFGFAAVVVLVALCLQLSNWLRVGVVNWPIAVNMLGLLVLMTTGAVDPPAGPFRLGLTVIALALILPSSFLLVWR